MFNPFLNVYQRIFNSCFPLQTVSIKENSIKKNWINKGIKISCSNKRKLYLGYRQNPNEETKRRHWLYSTILSNVVKEAKKMYYDSRVLTTNNKCKTTWDINNEITGNDKPKLTFWT
jgi:hypothetical protein